MNPGDTGRRGRTPRPQPTLNEGRGMNPGDTEPGRGRGSARRPLNEGRGMNPGDTRRGRSRPATLIGPLNEGRGMNPGDTRSRTWPGGPPSPLNEGRGMNPGDTAMTRIAGCSAGVIAQRRPGDEPRRHLVQVHRIPQTAESLNEGRGMNPGDTANVKEQLAESDGKQNLPLDGRLLDIVHAPAQEKTRLARDHRGLIPARRGCRTQDHRTFAGFTRPKDLQVRGLSHDPNGCESRRSGPGSGRRQASPGPRP